MRRRKLLAQAGIIGALSIPGCIGKSKSNQWQSRLNEEESAQYGPENTDSAREFHPFKPLSSDTIERLRSGGYIVYFRHEATQNGDDQHDTEEALKSKRNATATEDLNQTQINSLNNSKIPEWDYADCSLQRNLTLAGWRRAIGTGHAFDILDIGVGQVLSSPWCRCFKTAQLAFHRYKKTLDLDFTKHDNRDRLEPIFQKEQNGKSNMILVAHTLGSMELGDLFDVRLGEGQCMVLNPSESIDNAFVDGP
jgi:hypothetical protein